MKLFVTRLLSFVLIALCMYPTGVVLYGYFISGPEYSQTVSSLRFAEARRVSETDILFLGPSHARRGFDPRIFAAEGWNTFNLGSDSQAPQNTLLLLKRYLRQMKPKLVIYEVCPISLAKASPLESSVNIMQNDQLDQLSVAQVFEGKSLKLVNSWIYAMARSRITTLNKELEFTEGETYISGGHLEHSDCEFILDYKLSMEDATIDIEQLDAFDQGVQMIRDQNISIVFVSTPIHADYSDGNEALSLQFKKVMAGYQPYFDFSEFPDLRAKDFYYDPYHLNQCGVVAFNQKLIEILRTLKDFPFNGT